MSERVLLKLGGSVITDKAADGIIRSDAIERIAETIAGRKGKSLVIVHGAGSCGHPEASRYQVKSGVSAKNREGIFITHMAVRRLNDHIVMALRNAGVEAVGVQPLSACVADGGWLVSCEYRQLECMLGLGIVPVLHGDMVMDCSCGASVVSGDQLVRVLSTSLGIRRVGLATDVPGVLHDGKVLHEITPAMMAALSLGESGHTDVTGGMRGKVKELCQLAEAGIPSDIFHVSRIGDFLDEVPHGGTSVRGEKHV
ncbi:MAG: isopentenyl phosphate kinase [Methanomicrobiales archaeon]